MHKQERGDGEHTYQNMRRTRVKMTRWGMNQREDAYAFVCLFLFGVLGVQVVFFFTYKLPQLALLSRLSHKRCCTNEATSEGKLSAYDKCNRHKYELRDYNAVLDSRIPMIGQSFMTTKKASDDQGMFIV